MKKQDKQYSKKSSTSSMPVPRDSLQDLAPDQIVQYMFQQFPIDDKLADGRRFPPIGCLRYSLVDLLNKGSVKPYDKLTGSGPYWKSNRTEKEQFT